MGKGGHQGYLVNFTREEMKALRPEMASLRFRHPQRESCKKQVNPGLTISLTHTDGYLRTEGTAPQEGLCWSAILCEALAPLLSTRPLFLPYQPTAPPFTLHLGLSEKALVLVLKLQLHQIQYLRELVKNVDFPKASQTANSSGSKLNP